MTGPLSTAEITRTASWIASVQLPNGMIPWFPGGHADPWNHTESAMALVLAGRRREAERAFEWLASTQLPDGTWCRYHLAEGVEDPRRDPNVGAYVATGSWWHYLRTGDVGFLEEMWPVVEGAVGFALRLQQPGGEVLWSMDPDGRLGRYALLTATSSILHSLRCAVAVAARLGVERPEWELAVDRMVEAIAHRPGSFEPKDRWAMDWYYPVLSGALSGESAGERLDERWHEFVLDGVGVRCVSDQPWVTAAETAECVMALDAAGLGTRAAELLDWTRHMRDADGAYWTGCVHPACVRYPGGERSTYTAAAVLLADHALYGYERSAGLFRGETLPVVVDVAGVAVLGEG
ncbi:MAG: prenyltransferase [Acidimicrobiales bacterium]